MKMTHDYKEEWTELYQFLENIRQSVVVNMYGARPYLAEYIDFNVIEPRPNASTVLASWMRNYDALVNDGVIDRDDNWGRTD